MLVQTPTINAYGACQSFQSLALGLCSVVDSKEHFSSPTVNRFKPASSGSGGSHNLRHAKNLDDFVTGLKYPGLDMPYRVPVGCMSTARSSHRVLCGSGNPPHIRPQRGVEGTASSRLRRKSAAQPANGYGCRILCTIAVSKVQYRLKQ